MSLIGEGVGVDACLTHVHHVVVQVVVASTQQFDGFGDTLSRDESVGGGNGRNDVLDHSHCELVGDALNAEDSCSLQRLLVDPSHVLDRVLVHHLFSKLFFPADHIGVLDAVLRNSGSLSDCAHGVACGRRQRAQTALKTASLEGNDHS